jgi:hypothetical protein
VYSPYRGPCIADYIPPSSRVGGITQRIIPSTWYQWLRFSSPSSSRRRRPWPAGHRRCRFSSPPCSRRRRRPGHRRCRLPSLPLLLSPTPTRSPSLCHAPPQLDPLLLLRPAWRHPSLPSLPPLLAPSVQPGRLSPLLCCTGRTRARPCVSVWARLQERTRASRADLAPPPPRSAPLFSTRLPRTSASWRSRPRSSRTRGPSRYRPRGPPPSQPSHLLRYMLCNKSVRPTRPATLIPGA